MTHNDVLRSIRHLLNVSDAVLVDIFRLGNREVSRTEVVAFLKTEDEAGYQPCPDKAMACFLNGLVTYKRGKQEGRPPPPVEVPVTNNTVLKKLRVAFELTDDDIIALLQKNGLRVSKTELGAFFRRPDHRNYRAVRRSSPPEFLKGLSRLRPDRVGVAALAGATFLGNALPVATVTLFRRPP